MYAVLIKRKGSVTELLYGKYKTKEKAIRARSIAGKDTPARNVHNTKRTYPREITPK